MQMIKRTHHKEFLLVNSLVAIGVEHVERNAESRLWLCNTQSLFLDYIDIKDFSMKKR